jgi:hypothetical protein
METGWGMEWTLEKVRGLIFDLPDFGVRLPKVVSSVEMDYPLVRQAYLQGCSADYEVQDPVTGCLVD